MSKKIKVKKDKEKIILLAEDDKYISAAYKSGLERVGYKVLHAVNGIEALRFARQEIPDIVLLDIIMPTMDGFEVLEEFKADKMLKSIPVIVLSNLGQDADIIKAKAMGAIDYLVKSNYSMVEVLKKIDNHLGKIRGKEFKAKLKK
ncbi:response regulator transcription factor [Patescibacteria group bacterium]